MDDGSDYDEADPGSSKQATDDSDEAQAPLYDAGPSRHRPCLVLSVLNWGLALFTAWCASDGDDLETPYRDGCSAFISVPASLWAVLYLIMLLEAFASHTRRYIANVRSIHEVVAMLDRVRASAPVLCLHLECYHFETRSRKVTHTGANGRRTTTTHRTKVKVVTHRESHTFRYGRAEDVTGRAPLAELTGLTKLELSLHVAFADQPTAVRFANLALEMQTRNERRDAQMALSHTVAVDGLEPFVVVAADSSRRTSLALLRPSVFLLVSALGLSWPYRVWVDRACSSKSLHVVKHIGSLEPPGPAAASADVENGLTQAIAPLDIDLVVASLPAAREYVPMGGITSVPTPETPGLGTTLLMPQV